MPCRLPFDFNFSRVPPEELRRLSHPFDLETSGHTWTESLRQINPPQFRKGGNRICVPLITGDNSLGIVILADRVAALPYTLEELDLLECIADQLAASLLNLSLTQAIVVGTEREAFQTISAFFVHDLKNTASTLSLMLQNLPVHFDDPEFRQDALRGITKTVSRINQLIEGLGVLRSKLELQATTVDLNLLVSESLTELEKRPGVEWVTKFESLPDLMADRNHLQSVITNLLLNACDAIGPSGKITVETAQRGRWAALTVADNGCGMSAAFVRDSLFRPFQTTKKQGLGIGMFQSKMIIEAHGGNIQVKSEPGAGTTFEVRLPLQP
jgi:putative PEP-CTERM system histidine kinase